MAVGDLAIANSVKNELLKAQYTIGYGDDKDFVYISIGESEVLKYNPYGRLVKFKFENGVASFESNDPIMFTIEAEANETIQIKYIFIHSEEDNIVSGEIKAIITLQGDEIFTVIGGDDGNVEALAISNIQINLTVLQGGN